jgi:hypothetical protein
MLHIENWRFIVRGVGGFMRVGRRNAAGDLEGSESGVDVNLG